MSNWFDRRYTDAHWDHERDLRKHDTPPRRLSPPIATALEVAVLVKGVKDIREAEKLVEQYAQTVAAEARLQATIDTSDRIMKKIGEFGGTDA